MVHSDGLSFPIGALNERQKSSHRPRNGDPKFKSKLAEALVTDQLRMKKISSLHDCTSTCVFVFSSWPFTAGEIERKKTRIGWIRPTIIACLPRFRALVVHAGSPPVHLRFIRLILRINGRANRCKTTNYIVRAGTTRTADRLASSILLLIDPCPSPSLARLSRPIAQGPMEIYVPANYVSRARVTFRVDLRASARNYVKLHGAAGEEIVRKVTTPSAVRSFNYRGGQCQ